MKRAWFLAFGAAILLSVSTVYAHNLTTLKTQPAQITVAPTRTSLLALVNQERAKYGVAPLKLDDRLNTSAQMKADDEVKYNYSGHISPITGKNSHDFILSTGIQCTATSENLSWNSDGAMLTAHEAVKWWIKSKPHHLAMINEKYTLTGFGINNNEIVEHFCTQ